MTTVVFTVFCPEDKRGRIGRIATRLGARERENLPLGPGHVEEAEEEETEEANWQRDARVQGSRPRLGRGRKECAHCAIRIGMFHGEVRPDDRGLLPEGNRGGQLAVRTRDPRHRRYRTVREYARSLYKERARVRRRVQFDESPDLPGHQGDEGINNARERHREGTGASGREQARPGSSARGGHRGG